MWHLHSVNVYQKVTVYLAHSPLETRRALNGYRKATVQHVQAEQRESLSRAIPKTGPKVKETFFFFFVEAKVVDFVFCGWAEQLIEEFISAKFRPN